MYRYRPEVASRRLPYGVRATVRRAPITVTWLTSTRWRRPDQGRRRPPLGSGCGPAQQPKQSHVYMTSLSYVTGAHSFKAGIQHRLGMGEGPPRRHQRRPESAVSQRQRLRGADLQYAARDHRGRERRSRPLRAGDLDHQASDVEPRAPLRLFQLVDPGSDGAGRPLRAGALVRRRRQPPELEGCHRPHGCRLRPVRRRQDRDQGQYRSVHAVGGVGLCGDLQSADSRQRTPAPGPTSTATTSRRRSSSGRRATGHSACGATGTRIRISRGPIRCCTTSASSAS